MGGEPILGRGDWRLRMRFQEPLKGFVLSATSHGIPFLSLSYPSSLENLPFQSISFTIKMQNILSRLGLIKPQLALGIAILVNLVSWSTSM